MWRVLQFDSKQIDQDLAEMVEYNTKLIFALTYGYL